MKNLKSINKSIAAIFALALIVTVSSCGNDDGSDIVIEPDVYTTVDQMGRPAINTVFNFFGDAATKNGYNMTLPSEGSANAAAFTDIFNALQTYIFLEPANYTNLLGFDNAGISGALAVDVLNSNKNFATTYGPSDLNNIVAFQNVLNGRGLSNDVVDVTLILAFGADLQNLSATQMGLIGDNIGANDKSFSSTFPYLATPH